MTALQNTIASLVALTILCCASHAIAQDARPNPDKELPDVTATFQKLIDDGSGEVRLATGRHRITAPLVFDLAKLGAVSVTSDGPVTLILDSKKLF